MTDIVLDPLRWQSLDGADEALLDTWLVTEGDHVQGGQVVARAVLVDEQVDVQAPQEGMVEQIAVSAGERFGPGYILARLVSS